MAIEVQPVHCGKVDVYGPARGQRYRKVRADIRPDGALVYVGSTELVLDGPVEHAHPKRWSVATADGAWRIEWCGCGGRAACVPL